MYFHLHGTVTVIDFIHIGKNSTTGCVLAGKVEVLLQCSVDDLHHVKYNCNARLWQKLAATFYYFPVVVQ